MSTSSGSASSSESSCSPSSPSPSPSPAFERGIHVLRLGLHGSILLLPALQHLALRRIELQSPPQRLEVAEQDRLRVRPRLVLDVRLAPHADAEAPRQPPTPHRPTLEEVANLRVVDRDEPPHHCRQPSGRNLAPARSPRLELRLHQHVLSLVETPNLTRLVVDAQQ
eukprot:7084149-Prymnesium_polylepis.2